jgi:imidazolonepropionase-like amidohydrolase
MAEAARTALRGGVTTVRDLGDRGYLALGLRAASATDPTLPTILAAGPPITVTGGHCWYLGGESATDATSLARAVRERADRSCDVVKVMATGGSLTPTFPMWQSQFDAAALRVITTAAHDHGLPVAAHCHGAAGARDAFAAGVDSIEHCTFLDADMQVDVDESLLAAIASSGVGLSMTFGALAGQRKPPAIEAVWDDMIRIRRRLCELGATIVVGTDAGIAPGKPHDVLPLALSDLREIGLSRLDALRSITSVAARVCGVNDRKGRLAPGFDADIIAVNGDALGEDAAFVVSAVWKAGTRVV